MNKAKKIMSTFTLLLDSLVTNAKSSQEIEAANSAAERAFRNFLRSISDVSANVGPVEAKQLAFLKVRAHKLLSKKLGQITEHQQMEMEDVDLDIDEALALRHVEAELEEPAENETVKAEQEEIQEYEYVVVVDMMDEGAALPWLEEPVQDEQEEILKPEIMDEGAALPLLQEEPTRRRARYICSICLEQCKTSVGLFHHQKQCNESMYKYACDCGRLTKTMQQMGGHQRFCKRAFRCRGQQ